MSRQVGEDRNDSRRLVTNGHSCEATMHANDESNTNKQVKKVSEYSSSKKGYHKHNKHSYLGNTKHPNT